MQNEIEVPAGMRKVKLTHSETGDYFLTFSEVKSSYEDWIGHVGGPDDNAKLLISLLKGKGTLIDVGANIGTIAIPVAITGSRVLALEMNPTNCLKLWISCATNKLRNVAITHAAICDRNGVQYFEGEEAWGHISERGTPVVGLKLDTIVSSAVDLMEPVIIKIDIEGYEHVALQGARKTIEQYRPVILFESIEVEGEKSGATVSKKFLEDAGYNLFLCRGDILVPRKSDDFQEGHVCDFLAVPSEKLNVISGLNVRALSPEESMAWIQEMAAQPFENHKKHAARVLLRLADSNRITA